MSARGHRRAAAGRLLLALAFLLALALARPGFAHAATPSVAATVTPHISLSVSPIAVRSHRPVTARAVVDGIAVESTSCATVVLSRFEHSSWVERQRVPVTITSQTSTRTVLRARFLSNGRGRWIARLRLSSTTSSETHTSKSAGFIVVGPRWVALTFDDGPWPSSTDRILRVLKSRHVKATFFMLGAQVKHAPARARRVSAAGHQIGDHSWDHADLTRLSTARIRRELSRTKAQIRKTCGRAPTVFRPPYGSTSRRIASVGKSLGMRQVLWTVDPTDWRRPPASTIRRRVVSHVKTHGIVLMHDGGGNRSNTVRALPGIIDTLRHRGYYFVTMAEWQVLHSTR